MVLLETLTLGVGSAIGKSLLKVWLKDLAIEQEIGLSILDILKSKGADIIAQRRGERQFEAIGEKVVENLLPLFDESSLTEDSKVFVAQEVAKTINQVNITSAVLAKSNLDPSELLKYFYDSNPEIISNFSKEQNDLYQYVLKESADYILDISSQFPHFTERTLCEILKRENLLIDRAEKILKEVRQIRKGSRLANIEEDLARFEEEYRRSVVRNLDTMELFGIDTSASNRKYPLSVAYVSLSVLQKIEVSNKEEERFVKPVNDILADSQRIIIRGQAGSGKTTLIKWIAVNSAGQTFNEQLAELNNFIPFMIPLRQCSESKLPAPEDFPYLIAPAIAGKMPDRWVHNCLDSGRAIVLVDGVDEVPQTYRTEVHSWLKELVETYGKASFIVTTRPNAIEEGWLNKEGFVDTEIQMMELPDIYKFIDHWHCAIREDLQYDEEKKKLDDLKNNLKEVVKLNRPIRNLATSPLLCAVLCALHRDRNRQLPSDRIELYDAICYMLLERRTMEQHLLVETKDYPQLSYRQKRMLFEELAYRMMINTWSMISIERFDEILDHKIKNMETIAERYKSSEIRRLFIDRSGMIRMPIAGQIDFIHRTFQEFLTAKAAIDNRDIGLLSSKADDDQWREVIVLAAGLSSKDIREELICDLIKRGDNEASNRHQFHLLAVACLETSIELSPKVREEVRKRLTKLVPPENITEAKALSSADDLAVPYLKYKSTYYSTTAVACVRCLALIGSEVALEALKSYKHEKRQTVLREILKAASSFDNEKYGHELLSQFTADNLSLDYFSSLNEIQYLSHLTSLELYGTRDQVKDLNPLINLTKLTHLKLIQLWLIKDLIPLSNLTELHTLDISDFPQIDNLKPLSNLTELVRLYILNCSKIIDLSPLSNLIELEILNLSGCSQIIDLTPLSNLNNLHNLGISDCSQITDLTPLVKIKKLKFLGGIPSDLKLPKDLASRLITSY